MSKNLRELIEAESSILNQNIEFLQGYHRDSYFGLVTHCAEKIKQASNRLYDLKKVEEELESLRSQLKSRQEDAETAS